MENRIKHVIQELKSFEMLTAHLSNLEHRKLDYTQQIESLQREIIKGQQEIENFKDLNLNTLFLKAQGLHEITIQEHQQYYLELSIEINDLVKAMELIDFEIGVISNQLETSKEILDDFKLELASYDETLLNHKLKKYQQLILEFQFKLRYEKELSEAIVEGIQTIQKLDESIAHLNSTLFKQDRPNSLVEKSFHDLGTKGLNKYKVIIISINHAFIKYIGEVNEVFILVMENKQLPKESLKNFIEYYRKVLINDLMNATNFESSIAFLNKYKEVIVSLNAELSQEMEMLKNDLDKLEEKELEVIKSLAR